MHGGANDIGHDIAGGKNDGPRLDLAITCETNAHRPSGGIECNGLALEQPRAARDSQPEQPVRQLHGIGIGRTRGDDRPGTREAETIEQHAMVEKIAGQRGALAQPMLFEQLSAAIARRKIQRIFLAHVAGDAELPDERFQAGDGIEAGAIGPRGALEAIDFAQLP